MRSAALSRHIPEKVLSNVPFLTSLEERQLDALLPFMRHHAHRRGAFIVRAGEHADRVYILISGRANVILDDGTGREMVLCALGPHEFFGEMSAIDGQPRSAAVQAVEACEVIWFPRTAFLECLSSSPPATMLLVKSLIARLRATDVRVMELAFADVTTRLARVLLQAARDRSGEWVVEQGPEQMARMVAASREMVSRVLKRLQEQRIVRKENRSLILVDRSALRNLARPRS
jgi:CRP/FNR family transcriptional regulator, cyclic AMP receptor protein